MRDWRATQRVLPAKYYDLVVIDHYGLDANWHSLCRTYAKRVLVVDDLANRHLDCDFLLDSNYDDGLADQYSGLISSATEKLLGPRYLLKSRALIEVASQVDSLTPDEQSVSICFGGSDPLDYSAAACQALASLPQNWQVDCIIGPQYRNVQRLALTLAGLSNFNLRHNPKDIFNIVAGSRVSIGAAGGMMLERLLLMVPSLVAPIAENQLKSVDKLSELGAICLIPPEVVSSPNSLLPKVMEMANDENLRLRLRDLSYKLFEDTRTHNLVAGILD
jgi:spore coat polysaccharide biosynthesis predicted glycosyltransferase SpsG